MEHATHGTQTIRYRTAHQQLLKLSSVYNPQLPTEKVTFTITAFKMQTHFYDYPARKILPWIGISL